MIDLKQELSEYHAINIEEIERTEPGLSDNIRNSIILYNKAIESLKTGSEDIALIELKKATSMNPNFYEALNLLGLCYGYKKEDTKAEEIFNRVIREENNSIRALKYLKMMNAGENMAGESNKSRKKSIGKKQISQNKQQNLTAFWERLVGTGKNENVRRMNIIRIAAGFIAGILLAVVIGAIIPGRPAQNTSAADKTSSQTASDQGKDYKALYDDMSQKYSQIKDDNVKLNQQLDNYKSLIKLYDAESTAANGQYENAADMLLLLKNTAFTGDDKTKFENLYNTVMPKAAHSAFDEGYSLYNNKRDYQSALKKFQKTELYDPKFARNDALFYYIGKCYQKLNDTRNAVVYFQKLIDTYPDSSYVKNARIRLKTLTSAP